jgi:hypothetical protein
MKLSILFLLIKINEMNIWLSVLTFGFLFIVSMFWLTELTCWSLVLLFKLKCNFSFVGQNGLQNNDLEVVSVRPDSRIPKLIRCFFCFFQLSGTRLLSLRRNGELDSLVQSKINTDNFLKQFIPALKFLFESFVGYFLI